MTRHCNHLLFSILLICFSFQAQAQTQTDQNAINQQDWITRQQQNITDEKKRDDEFDTIKKEHERQKKEEEEELKRSLPSVTGKVNSCFLTAKIILNGADSLSTTQQQKITAPFIGKCMEPETMANLIKAVNDYYHSLGYVTAQVKVPKQNLHSEVFELQIIEGKIEKIIFGKDRFIEKMQEFTAFGNAEGEVLNINDVDQGMYQINRLQSNQAVMKIEPGNEIGQSKIVIDNNKKFPARATVSKDNLGNQFTGVQRTNFSSTFDNLLSLNDNLNLNYTTNLHDDSSIKNIKSFSGSLSIPFKYDTLSYDFSHATFKGQNPGENGSSTLTGFSQSSKVTLDHVFLNQHNLKLSSAASLAGKQSASYVNGSKVTTSQRNLTVLNLSFVASVYLNEASSIYLKPSYSKGLKILNAQQDNPNQSNTNPKAQFDYFKLYANFSQRFVLPRINAPVTFTTEMDSQYAKQTLFGSEQFSIGGYYSVRGFRENYINGDSGYYFRNKINFNAGSIVAPLLRQENQENKKSGFFAEGLAALNKVYFEPFFDYGYSKNKYIDGGADGRLSGTGLKTIFAGRYFNASLTYSWATSKSRLLTSTVKENKLVYFEISASCC